MALLPVVGVGVIAPEAAVAGAGRGGVADPPPDGGRGGGAGAGIDPPESGMGIPRRYPEWEEDVEPALETKPNPKKRRAKPSKASQNMCRSRF